MKSAGKARSNGLYRHIRTSKEIIRNLLNDLSKKSIIKQVQTAMTRQMINVQKATARITRSSQIVNGKNPNIAPI